jgi:hypothetical protein
MIYWVIHIIKSTSYAYPYRTPEGARNRFDKVQGGEVYIHRSNETDAQRAVDEFKADLVAGKV